MVDPITPPDETSQGAVPPQPAQPSQEQTGTADAAILEQLRNRWRTKRQVFLDTYDTIEQYSYGQDYDKLLYAMDDATSNMKFKAKINRASEFAEIMGTYIFPQVPDAQVNSRKWAPYWAKKRHEVEEEYLDYALWSGDYHSHARKEVTEALLSGRGLVYTGFNANKGVVQNVYRCVRDLLMDADAKNPEEINGIAIKRTKPKWELKALIQQVRGDDAMDSIIDGLTSINDGANTKTAAAATGTDKSLDTCDYYEFYLKVGLWRFGSTTIGSSPTDPNNPDAPVQQDDSPRKYYWVPGTILAISEWELPLYLIDEWPVSWVDMRPRPNHLWPAAPIEPGLTHLQSLNWMYSFYMNRIRFAWRTFMIAINYNGQGVDDGELMKLVYGGDFDFLRVNVKGNEHDFDKLVQQFKIDSGIAEFKMAWELATDEFAKATGLSEILYTGEGARQSRIKADVDFKAKQSQNRIEDMHKLFIDHMSMTMRKTLFAARFLHTPDEIGKMLGPEAQSVWGTLADPQKVQAEQQQRAQRKQQMLMQAQAALKQYQAMLQHMPPVPPGAVAPPMIPPPPKIPTNDEMEQQLGPPQLVSMDDWIHEADRTVDAGSVRPMDHDAKVDNLQQVLGQLGPVIAQIPGGAGALAVALKELSVLAQNSQELQDAFDKMAMMANAAPPVGPPPGAAPQPKPAQPTGRPPGQPA